MVGFQWCPGGFAGDGVQRGSGGSGHSVREHAAALDDEAAPASLADYAIARHYPQAREEPNPYLAFLDAYRYGQVFSSIDSGGRYAWGRQSAVAAWNHARLAEALLPLLDRDPDKAVALAQASLERFKAIMEEKLSAGLARKLGLSRRRDGDEALIQSLLAWMEDAQADFTATFRGLTQQAAQDRAAVPLPDEPWLHRWSQRLEDKTAPVDVMLAANPRIHPRNRPVQSALDAAEQGDLEPFRRLAAALALPGDPDSALPELEPAELAESRPFKTYCGT